nr:PREDICTED: uncharacterized protein LOC108952578 [Musa acuminata subsp. malaccensis]
MRLPWSDESLPCPRTPLRAEHVRRKPCSNLPTMTKNYQRNEMMLKQQEMFCIDAIDEKGGQPFEQLDSVVAFNTTPGAGTEVAADGSNLGFRVCISHEYLAHTHGCLELNCGCLQSTIASRDASYRHQVNLDRGGRKWKSNQVEESVLNSFGIYLHLSKKYHDDNKCK